ncbi:type VI secretion system contractile sheath small subunit [Emticicia sp. 17c]|uniref:type VI secretion system contractile sheath small subunit n=1 Tax=Emticicia sp. 17c TaxID=3127704 RepID=UPI00301CDCAC
MAYTTKTLPPGGTEKERESNAKVEYLNLDKTAIVGQFSYDAPSQIPEVLSDPSGITLEDVFKKFEPTINVDLKDKEGNLHDGVKVNFKKMQDFNPKEITNSLPLMKDLKESEEGYNTMLRQLKNNTVFNRLLKKPEARQSLINLFSSLIEELENSEK